MRYREDLPLIKIGPVEGLCRVSNTHGIEAGSQSKTPNKGLLPIG